MKSRFLSKTKEQHIAVTSSFKNVEVPSIIAETNSILQSSDLDLNNLLTNSLMRNTTQTIDAAWHFEELHISKAVLIENNKILSFLNIKRDNYFFYLI